MYLCLRFNGEFPMTIEQEIIAARLQYANAALALASFEDSLERHGCAKGDYKLHDDLTAELEAAKAEVDRLELGDWHQACTPVGVLLAKVRANMLANRAAGLL